MNDVILGYIAKALDNLKLKKTTKMSIISELHYLFDTKTYEEMEYYYKNL